VDPTLDTLDECPDEPGVLLGRGSTTQHPSPHMAIGGVHEVLVLAAVVVATLDELDPPELVPAEADALDAADAVPDAELETEADPETEPEAEAETEPDPETDAEPDSEPEPEEGAPQTSKPPPPHTSPAPQVPH
jgi:hypothetical protein